MADQGMLSLIKGALIQPEAEDLAQPAALTDNIGVIQPVIPSDRIQGLPTSCTWQREPISMEQLVSMRGMRSKLVQQAPVVAEEEEDD